MILIAVVCFNVVALLMCPRKIFRFDNGNCFEEQP